MDLIRTLLASPPLDAPVERALARRARRGDLVARDQLIRASLRLVVMRARSRGLRGEALQEAVQAGTEGLIHAVDRYDPDRGARLATFAWHYIGAAMKTSTHAETVMAEVPEPGSHSQAGPGSGECHELADLPEALQAVARLRWGLGVDETAPLSRRAVGERLGLSVAEVRTREAQAMRQLRGRLARVSPRAPRRRGAGPL